MRRVEVRPAARAAACLAAAVLAVLFVGTCESGPDAGREAQIAAAGRSGDAAFDISGVIRRVRFAYRQDGGDLRAAADTYRVRVDGNGRIAFAPVRPATAKGRAATVGAELILSTDSIRRAGAEIGALRLAPRTEDGGVAIQRTGALERLANGERGVHQTWTFAARTHGAGDLTLRIAVGGLGYRGETAMGLHFVDPRTGLGVRYGRATWIDAAGRRSEVAAKFAAGAIVLTVPARVVDGSAFPAVLDPEIGPETGMDEPIFRPLSGDQIDPAVARGDGDWLVVWADGRDGAPGVYGARVDETGLVLDPDGIAITTGSGDQSAPAVAFDGTTYLVVWEDGGGSDLDVRGRRVSAGGVALGPEIVVAGLSDDQRAPAVAGGTGGWIVAWADYRDRAANGADIYAQRITAGGLLAGAELPITTVAADQGSPAVSYGPLAWLIVWEDAKDGGWDIRGQVVGEDGLLVGNHFDVCTAIRDQRRPSAAYTEGRWLVAWEDLRNLTSTGWDIYAQRLLAGGEPEGGEIAVLGHAGEQVRPTVAETADGWLVAWQDDRDHGTTGYDVYVRDIAKNGNPTGPALVVSTAADGQERPRAAAGGPGAFIVWTDRRDADDAGADVFGQRVAVGGAPSGDPVRVTIGLPTNVQHEPAVAWNGTDYLVVWQDDREGDWDVRGVRVSAEGEVLDPDGVALFVAENDQTQACAAFDGQTWRIVWEDARGGDGAHDLYGLRVGDDGLPIGDGDPVVIDAANQADPAIACDGTNCLIAWIDDRSGNEDVYARLIARDGTPVGSAVAACAEGSDQAEVAVAFDGTNYLLAWQDPRGGAGNADVYAQQVSASGGLVGANFAVSTAAGAQHRPAVAFAENVVLVAWDQAEGLYAQRVAKSRALLGANFAVSTGAGDQSDPAIAYDGMYFVVAWVSEIDGRGDLYAARVDSDGTVMEPDGLAITAETTDVLAPAVASGGGGAMLAVYSRADLDEGHGSERVRGRAFTLWTCVDEDGDGYGAVSDPTCPAGAGADCDDADPAVHPGVTDVCDGVDNDCSGAADDGPAAAASCQNGAYCDGAEACVGGHCVDTADPCVENANVCDGVTTCNEAIDRCQTSAAPNCNDGNVCTNDSCNAVTGCVHVNNTSACTDGLWCNGTDSCSGGTCSVHAGTPCGNDGQFCNGTESCNEATDQCVHSGSPCASDGLFCNGAESCNEATDQCVHAGDPCASDGLWCNGAESCNEATDACVHAGNPCGDDGLWCNGTESCNETADACVHSGGRCPDDGAFCNGTESCNEAADACVHSGDPCPDDATFCNGAESCDEAANQCVHAGDPCPDDGLWCNGAEHCDETFDQCRHETTGPEKCPDDGLWCNGAERCDEQADACGHEDTPATTCPDDGLWCNGSELCDEAADACRHTSTPEETCPQDGLFCDGVETCDEEADRCASAGDPCGDDALWCNGTEFCDETNDLCGHTSSPAETCPDDGQWCTGLELCDEEIDACIHEYEGDARCPSDGLWCDGREFCDEAADSCAHEFEDGARCPDDGLWCNGEESCDEEANDCVHAYADGERCPADALYCNGAETCDEQADACTHSVVTCRPDERCDEEADGCVPVEEDSARETGGCGA
jgi:hypothetical protein